MPFPAMILTYTIAGLLGGTVVGLLRPIGKYWWGAILTGIVGAGVVMTCVGIAMEGGVTHWDRVDYDVVVIYALIAGPMAGMLFWNRNRKAGATCRPRFGTGPF